MRVFKNRELRPHLLMVAALAGVTLLLKVRPQIVLGAGYTCELQALFGIRGPFCGMTRDFAAMLHGRPPALNPCSRAAALVVWVLYPAAVFIAWGTHRLSWFSSRFTRCAVVVLLFVMLVLNNRQ